MSNYNDLSEITDVNELCLATCEAYLNMNAPLFNITLVEKTDDEKWNNSNLVFNEQIHGAMQIISTKPVDEKSLSKTILMKVLLPYVEVKGNNLVDVGYACLENALMSLNRNQVTIDENRRLIFNSVILSNGGKLSKPINGIEYELYTMSFDIIVTETLLRGEVQYVEIYDGTKYTKLAGVFNIIEETSAQFEGNVPSTGVQKNYIASLQTGISIDFFVYKNSALHSKLFTEKKQKKDYSVKYFDGILTNEYTMRIAKLIKTGTVGDVVKAHITLVEKG